MINSAPAKSTALKSYAIVTPSFRLDLERCILLAESVESWVAPHVRHYIVVDRRDLMMFKPLESKRTSILTVEETAPPWLFRVPGIRRFWFSLRSRPVRNWILQQIVKLSVPLVVPEDVLLCTDSDTFFIAPYEPHGFERDGKVPLFVETGQRGLIPLNDEWHRVAAKLLGLAPQESYDTNYIGNVIPWRRDTTLAMHRRIEDIAGKPWQVVLASQQVFAEYILYGLFSQMNAKGEGLWNDNLVRTLCYWGTTPLSIEALEKLKQERQEHFHSLMISAKSRTPIADIRKVFL
jgi:Family of unknown function (DUF6492)